MSENKKEIEFPVGITWKAKSEKAPDFVIGGINIKKSDAIDFLQSKEGDWVNIDVLVSKKGKVYLSVNNWKKGDAPKTEEGEVDADAIPF